MKNRFKILSLIIFFSFSRISNAQNGIISTIVGNGYNANTNLGGYSGDGGQATNAELYLPESIAIDDSGNIYVSEFGNSVVRKVNSITGIILTIAGTGSIGYLGDGGPATSARLGEPRGLTLDKMNNLYIADYDNNVIRRVNLLSGVIITVAGNGYMARTNNGGYYGDGGLATNAELYHPTAIAFDPTGDFYIADALNNVIRKVDILTDTITTIAGEATYGFSGDGGPASAAEFHGPCGIATDIFGNIYIGDSENNRIRKIDASSGIINTIAGNGAGGNSGDGGPATSAELTAISVKLDVSGNIYFTNGYFNTREINTSGIIYTIAGNDIDGYSGDGGLATNAELNATSDAIVDALGNIYIADAGNNVLRKVSNSISTGLKEELTNTIIQAFPNPSTGIFTLTFSHPELVSESQTIVEIYNVLGEKVFTQIRQLADDNLINLAGQPSGVYLYRVLSKNGSLIGEGKIIVQR